MGSYYTTCTYSCVKLIVSSPISNAKIQVHIPAYMILVPVVHSNWRTAKIWMKNKISSKIKYHQNNYKGKITGMLAVINVSIFCKCLEFFQYLRTDISLDNWKIYSPIQSIHRIHQFNQYTELPGIHIWMRSTEWHSIDHQVKL